MSRPDPNLEEQFLTEPSDAARQSFGQAFERLVGVMARLRGEDGCPWDRVQTLETLKPFLIEEAYEVLDALDAGQVEHHKEELGDLLLQVVFQAEIRRQEGAFDAADVAHGIADKLVRRHPHVFRSDEAAADKKEAYARWEEIKSEEKGGRSVVEGVPSQLPALLRAQRIGEKAARVGFDWNDLAGPLEKLDEEVAELKAAIASKDPSAVEHELGDALFSMVNLARHLDVTAEDVLRRSVARFETRFRHVEAKVKASGKKLSEASLEEMESYWQEAKAQEH